MYWTVRLKARLPGARHRSDGRRTSWLKYSLLPIARIRRCGFVPGAGPRHPWRYGFPPLAYHPERLLEMGQHLRMLLPDVLEVVDDIVEVGHRVMASQCFLIRRVDRERLCFE